MKLKQHDCVFKPETDDALEQNDGVCCPFEGKPDGKQQSCYTKGDLKHPLDFLKPTPQLILNLLEGLELCVVCQ